jgi:prephenate dehydratase
MTIACQGAPGAFGHEACLAFAAEHEPVFRSSFAEVVDAVLEGEAEIGILPVENNEAGPVPGVGALLERDGLQILASHALPVRMHLLALPGVRMEQVRTIVSHPVALAQCAGTLRTLGLALEEADNTALAARALDSADRAVLASEAAARAYGLDILRRDLHDRPDNATLFTLFTRAPSP